MRTQVKMIIMSYLSDLQEGNMPFMSNNTRINFVKFLVMKYPNTEVEVSGAKEFADFKEKYPDL